MTLRNCLVLLVLVVVTQCCKSPDSTLQTSNTCRLSSYNYTVHPRRILTGGGYYLNNNKIDGTRTYSYNGKGELIGYYSLIKTIATDERDIITNSSNENKNTYELDNNGFVIKITSEFTNKYDANNTPWSETYTTVTHLQYDANGRIVQTIKTPVLDSTVESKQNYKYDSNGKLLSLVVVTGYKGLQWNAEHYYYTNGILTKYTLNSSNNLNEYEVYQLDNAGRIFQYGPDSYPNKKLAYDEKGNIIGDITYNMNILYSTINYEYDNMQNPFLTIPKLKGFPNATISTDVSLDNNSNNLLKKTFQYNTHSITDITLYDPTYNANGLLLSLIARDGTETYTYTYTSCN